jgi:hypothetical protein
MARTREHAKAISNYRWYLATLYLIASAVVATLLDSTELIWSNPGSTDEPWWRWLLMCIGWSMIGEGVTRVRYRGRDANELDIDAYYAD